MRKYLLMFLVFALALGASKKNSIQMPKTAEKNSSSVIADKSSGQPEFSPTTIPTIEYVSKSSFVPEPLGNATLISFSNGIEFDTKSLGKFGEPDLPAGLTTTYRDHEYGYYIVQVKGPIYEYQKTQLEANGVRVFFYIKNYAFVCGMPNQTTLNSVRAMDDVTWAGVYQPAYKTSNRIDKEPEEFTATILLFDIADLSKIVNSIKTITRSQNKFLTSEFAGQGYTNKIIRTKIRKSDIASIAKLPEIYWIEPWHQEVLCNQGSQWCLQKGVVDSARTIWRKGIRGAGQIICTSDTGVRPDQYFLDWPGFDPTTWYYTNSNLKVVAQQPCGLESQTANGWPIGSCSKWGDESGNSYHGTHTAGSTCGWDSARGGTSPQDGMAYQARLFFLDGGGDSGAVFLPGDLNVLYSWPYDSAPAHSIPRVYTMSNSWGDSTCNGGYDGECMETDQFCWTHKDFLIFFSNGNDGTGTIGNGIGHRSGSPASAKNVMAVGALTHPGTISGGAGAKASLSCMGPTADGRYKPDIGTPGEAVVSADGSSTSGTASMSGTSMASPLAAGTSLLIRQYLKEGWYPTGTKTAADSFGYILSDLIKAIIMHGDSVTGGSAYRQWCVDTMVGWGRVNLDTVLYFAGDSQRVLIVQNLTGLVTGEEAIYKFYMPGGGAHVRISLAWTDYPSTPASFGLINDLDLYLSVPTTPTHFYRGNVWTGTNSLQDPSTRDSVNVRESIRLLTIPASGIWTVKVQGKNIAYGPQPFALVITYRRTATLAVAGRVILDKPVYRANDFFVDTVLIRVEDQNLGTVGSVDNATVRLIGKRTETMPETLSIPEIAADAYVFERKIPLLFNKAVHNDGILSVAQDDTITAIYVDASPAFTDTAPAPVDANYFLIYDVLAELSPSGADIAIKWKTNENASQKVYYGLTPALGTVVQVDTPLTLNHVVNISSLSPDTLFYFDVESKDYRGNVVRDNNGARHYSFSTVKPKGADILVALMDGVNKSTPTGSPLPDLRSRCEAAVKNGGWAYDWWETSDHSGYLPARSVMKTYKAIFAPSEDEYPPYTRSQQDTITQYEQNGGRIAFSGHDFLWHAWDNSSTPGFDTVWCKNYLQARYKFDVATSGTFYFYGISGDPITDAYSSTPVSFLAHRTGAVADSFECLNTPPNGWDAGIGTATRIWLLNSSTNGRVGSKWESASSHGASGDGIWGGYKTRTIMNAFSVTQMDVTKLPDILNKEFIWLIGHDHPDATVTAPVAGTTYTSTPISISWTATYYGGAANDTTWIEYSSDRGGTWRQIVKNIGITSPYSWNLGTLQNHYKYRIKVTVSDKLNYPSLKGSGSTGDFIIKRSAGDTLGPVVSPQSIIVEKNPKIVTATDTLLNFTAVLNDSETGLSNISRARWFVSGVGEFQMFPEDGAWGDEIREKVLGAIKFNYSPGTTKICTLQVRGMDNAAKANNWGPYYTRTFTLIDGGVGGIGMLEYGTSAPLTYSLAAPLPNPFLGRVKIRYGLPRAKEVSLRVYNCLGQLVRKLVEGERKPGVYTITWDGRDDAGRDLGAGIYFYKFETDEFQDTKKAVLLR